MLGRRLGLYLLMACLVVFTACDDDSNINPGGDAGIPENPENPQNPDTPSNQLQTFVIAPGPDATSDAVGALIAADPGDTVQFECGFYELNTGLILNTDGVTITGCGRDKTVLSFTESNTPVGILVTNAKGAVVENLTVVDTPGDGIKTKSADIVTLRNVRAMWSSADKQVTAGNYQSAIHYQCPTDPTAPYTYVPDSSNGRYGIYPVQSTNVLLDNVESLGASDAGIYVGQSDNVIIRNSHAIYNVAGFEIENVRHGDMHSNVAECNTMGFLIYDLAFLSRYGTTTRMFDNIARNNNFQNFAAGGLVSMVPRGIGFLTLGYDRIEVFNNTFKDNSTAGIFITSYELIGLPGDLRLDPYSEAINIHNNNFTHNGYNPPPLDLRAILSGDQTALLSALIRIKNQGRGADILWDGLYDELNADCAYPNDVNGDPVPKNEYGKPIYDFNTETELACRYNAYKFNEDGERLKPEWWICIADNTFDAGGTPSFANFHGTGNGVTELLDSLAQDPTQLLPELIELLAPEYPGLIASKDLTPHHCVAAYGKTLEPLPEVTLATYTLPEGGSGEPTEAEIEALCTQDTDGEINYEALAQVNCPRLAQYHLFTDPEGPNTQDPTRANPNSHSVPYDLTTKLFSDYAVKYRIVFMPPGTTAQYRDAGDGPNATLKFPAGTVIAKTFSFPDESSSPATIDHVETRLLIKRQDEDGTVHWKGLPYTWYEEDGKQVAKLTLGGGIASVSWHYTDDTGALHVGSTDEYRIPNALQCQTCHANTDRPAGSPPIGPKARAMNKPYAYPVAGYRANQIKFWVDNGFLEGAPADLGVDPNTLIAENVERIPRFDVPGDAGFPAFSDKDIEARARAWLAVNCAHCHNPGGAASNTGLYLNSVKAVDAAFGICKPPTAAGAGSGGRPVDIYPGDASQSVLTYRIDSNEADVQMPPIARSVIHEEAVALVKKWINMVVDGSYPNASACLPGASAASLANPLQNLRRLTGGSNP